MPSQVSATSAEARPASTEPTTVSPTRAAPRETASAASAPVRIPASTSGSTDEPRPVPALGVVTTSSTTACCSAAACVSSWATAGLAAVLVSTLGADAVATKAPYTSRSSIAARASPSVA